MPTMLLTKRAVDAAQPKAERYELHDAKLKGFGLRVSPSGEKTWFIAYRAGDGGRNATKRRYTLGKVGALTPDQAREAAQKLLAGVKLGADPSTAKAVRRAIPSVKELANLFLARHVAAKRKGVTADGYAAILTRIVIPVLGAERADSVSRGDMARLHLAWSHTPYQANRMLAVVGSMYTFGARSGLTPEGCNPTHGIDRFREDRRERFLSADELERIGAAIRLAETLGVPWEVDPTKVGAKHLPKDPEKRRTKISSEAAAALRLLIFTGARVSEILNLRWAEVDLQRGLLLLPDSKTGRKTIVLNEPALAVLRGLKKIHVTHHVGQQPIRRFPDLL